jgi:hypothetical protein
MKRSRMQVIVLAATMLLATFAAAQQEVAPDHFDEAPAAAQKARVVKTTKQTHARKNVAKRQTKANKGAERQIAMAGK